MLGIIELCSVDFIHSGYVIIVDSCAYKNKQFSKTKQYTQHTPWKMARLRRHFRYIYLLFHEIFAHDSKVLRSSTLCVTDDLIIA